ncbi:MAG: hypothetical protein SF070_00800 [Gemmatimonadota bacterium]|nr:hypothetical protein [Gemmatimonadota bacterium]
MSFSLAVLVGVWVLILVLRRQQEPRRRPPPPPEPDGGPRRLALLGYWAEPGAPPDQSPGWPDPHDLVGEWQSKDRRAVVAYFERGTLLREFPGFSPCRFCGQQTGAREFTDGFWAWPEGLTHYVEAHGVRLPEAFLERVRAGPDRSAAPFLASLEPEQWVQGGFEAFSPIILKDPRPWITDQGAWLDWAAANTPARPREGAATLEEVRALCGRLSHSSWRAEVEEVHGRWRLEAIYGAWRAHWYLQRSPAGIVERRLLRLRPSDPLGLLTVEQANEIAVSCDGPWGQVRVVAGTADGWLVWSKRPADEWPTREQLETSLGNGMRFDQVGWTANGKYYPILLPDEPAWRWILTVEREEREAEAARQDREGSA